MTFDLLPTGAPNNVPVTDLNARMTAVTPTSSLVTLLSVTSAIVVPVCGNGVCEAGERPDAANGVTGCRADCPYPVAHCPSSNALPCSGNGLCSVSGSGTGQCTCFVAGGYSGTDCSTCALGFHAVGGACVHTEAALAVQSPSGGTPSSGGSGAGSGTGADGSSSFKSGGVTAVVVGSVVGGIVLVSAFVAALVKLKKHQSAARVGGSRVKPSASSSRVVSTENVVTLYAAQGTSYSPRADGETTSPKDPYDKLAASDKPRPADFM